MTMGASIGQLPATLSASRAALRRERPATPELGFRGEDNSDQSAERLGRSEEKVAVRAGFGEGTVSGPGAALITLSRGVRAAREIVPTLQELSAEARNRATSDRDAVQRDAIRRDTTPREAERPRVQSRVLEPATQARNFVNAINTAAGEVQSRVTGQPTPGLSRATFEIRGQTFSAGEIAASSDESPLSGPAVTPSRFDVRV